MDDKTRVELKFDLVTPDVEENYSVTFSTYHSYYNGEIDRGFVSIPISAVYGYMQEFRAHALKDAIRLKAGETGPLEMIYFLKHPLPAT